MITELSLKNFKSWKSTEKMKLAPITGLFGTNSSGKSSILQALLLLKQTIECDDRSVVLHYGNENTKVNLGNYQEIVCGHNLKNDVSLDIQWGMPKELTLKIPHEGQKLKVLTKGKSISFSTTIGKQKLTTLEKDIVKKLSYSFGNHTFSLSLKQKDKKAESTDYQLDVETTGEYKPIRFPGRAWPIPSPIKFYGFPEQVFSYYQNVGFLGELQQELVNLLASRISYLGPLREYPKRSYISKGITPSDVGQRGEATVDAIIAAREKGKYISRGKGGRGNRKQSLDHRIAEALKELTIIDFFEVKEMAEQYYAVRVKRHANSPEVCITDVGFGVSQILPILTLLYYVPEGSIVLLEQPEIHLHPAAQMALADVFIDAVSSRKIQIIFESHSEHILTRLRRRMAESQNNEKVKNKLDPSQVALYFCNSGEDGSSLLQKLEIDLMGNINNWPTDFFGNQFGEFFAIEDAKLRTRVKQQKFQQH